MESRLILDTIFPRKILFFFEKTCYFNKLQILVVFGPTFYVFKSFHFKFNEHFHATLGKREGQSFSWMVHWLRKTIPRLENAYRILVASKHFTLVETAMVILEDINISDCKWCFSTYFIIYSYLLKICHSYNRTILAILYRPCVNITVLEADQCVLFCILIFNYDTRENVYVHNHSV